MDMSVPSIGEARRDLSQLIQRAVDGNPQYIRAADGRVVIVARLHDWYETDGSDGSGAGYTILPPVPGLLLMHTLGRFQVDAWTETVGQPVGFSSEFRAILMWVARDGFEHCLALIGCVRTYSERFDALHEYLREHLPQMVADALTSGRDADELDKLTVAEASNLVMLLFQHGAFGAHGADSTRCRRPRG